MAHEDRNYRELSPPEDKSRDEYSATERRAELYDLIEAKGHYRNLERSQRELGRRYGVSHQMINKDIKEILKWQKEHLGNNAEEELTILKNAAVRDLVESGNKDDAYKLAKEHYQMLQDMGVKEKEPEKKEINIQDAWREVLSNESTEE